MTKLQSSVLAGVVLVLCVFVVFIAWQMVELHTQVLQLTNRDTGMESLVALQTEVASQKKRVDDQQSIMSDFSARLETLNTEIKTSVLSDLNDTLVLQPGPGDFSGLFSLGEPVKGVMVLTIHRAAFVEWLNQYQFVIGPVLRRGARIAINDKSQPFLQDVQAGSFLEQMGFKSGDSFAPVTIKSDELLSWSNLWFDQLEDTLRNLQKDTLTIQRDGKVLSLQLAIE